MPKVFISHRKADGELAGKLATELREAGLDVWFDEWNIGLGDSIVERIDEGLTDSAYVVVCYSSSGLSPWMNREWMSALSRQLSKHHVKLLPVLLSGGQPPAILADIRYADLVADWSAGVAELLRAIK